MQLKANPLLAFAQGDSPIALHVRRNYGGGSGRDDQVAGLLADKLLSGQQADGSWGGTVAQSIENLFALWLLGARGKETERGVNWLMETHRPAMRCVNTDGGRYDDMFFHMSSRADRDRVRKMGDVPFTPGCAGFVKTGAALFCALELEQGDAQRIKHACATLSHLFVYRKGRPCSGSCSMNLLTAMASAPARFEAQSLKQALAWTASQQQADGSWARGIPFYEMAYTLGRLPQKLGEAQLEKCLARAVRTQHRDGTWGQTHWEMKTFLLLPALRQAGLMPN